MKYYVYISLGKFRNKSLSSSFTKKEKYINGLYDIMRF